MSIFFLLTTNFVSYTLSTAVSKAFYKALGETTTWPELAGNISPTSITYSDVNLVPQITDIASRTEIDTSVTFGPYKLKIPFIGAPMDTILGELKLSCVLVYLDDIDVFSKIFNQHIEHLEEIF